MGALHWAMAGINQLFPPTQLVRLPIVNSFVALPPKKVNQEIWGTVRVKLNRKIILHVSINIFLKIIKYIRMQKAIIFFLTEILYWYLKGSLRVMWQSAGENSQVLLVIYTTGLYSVSLCNIIKRPSFHLSASRTTYVFICKFCQNFCNGELSLFILSIFKLLIFAFIITSSSSVASRSEELLWNLTHWCRRFTFHCPWDISSCFIFTAPVLHSLEIELKIIEQQWIIALIFFKIIFTKRLMKKELRTLMLLISDHLFTNKSQGNRPYADEPQHVIIQQQVSRLFIDYFF